MDDRVRLRREHRSAHGAHVEKIERDRLRTQGPKAVVVSGRPEAADHLVPTLDQLRHEPGADRSARACYEDSHRLFLLSVTSAGVRVSTGMTPRDGGT
jgi:hypothetical protein